MHCIEANIFALQTGHLLTPITHSELLQCVFYVKGGYILDTLFTRLRPGTRARYVLVHDSSHTTSVAPGDVLLS
jgi:hypothetical protein